MVGAGRHDAGACCDARRTIGAEVGDQLDFQAKNLAGIVHGRAQLLHLIAPVGGAGKALAACFDPFDRPLVAIGERGGHQVFRIDRPLGAERAADIGRDDAHMMLRDSECRRQCGAQAMGSLRRCPDRHLIGHRHEIDENGARFDERGLHPLIAQPDINDVAGSRERCIDIAAFDLPGVGEVVAPFRVEQRRVLRQRRFGIHHHVKRFVIDLHQFGGIGRRIEILGQHDRHGIADMTHPICRQRIARQRPVRRLLLGHLRPDHLL